MTRRICHRQVPEKVFVALILAGVIAAGLLPCGEGVTAPRSFLSPPLDPIADRLILKKVFHIVGIPGVKRNQRVDIQFNSKALLLQQGEKERLSVPYARIHRLQVLDGTRTHAKATYAAILAGGIGGAVLLLKKDHKDTLVFDYVNDHGGQMGLIVQVPKGKGAACRDWLRRFGVVGDEAEQRPLHPLGIRLSRLTLGEKELRP